MPWQSLKKNPGYNTAAWRRARAAQLRKDRWRCQLRLDGCQGAASEVDHIHGIDADPQHRFLRSVCSSCHKKRTAQQSGEARRGKTRTPKASDPPPTSRIAW